jgi:hypothetical protein
MLLCEQMEHRKLTSLSIETDSNVGQIKLTENDINTLSKLNNLNRINIVHRYDRNVRRTSKHQLFAIDQILLKNTLNEFGNGATHFNNVMKIKNIYSLLQCQNLLRLQLCETLIDINTPWLFIVSQLSNLLDLRILGMLTPDVVIQFDREIHISPQIFSLLLHRKRTPVLSKLELDIRAWKLHGHLQQGFQLFDELKIEKTSISGRISTSEFLNLMERVASFMKELTVSLDKNDIEIMDFNFLLQCTVLVSSEIFQCSTKCFDAILKQLKQQNNQLITKIRNSLT